MGLTGFNKRRREAAALAAKEAQKTVSPQPAKSVEDKPATDEAKPHKTGKKVQNVDNEKAE